LDGNPRKKAIKDYAAQTWVTEEWLAHKKCLARSFCGIPVEIRGKPWGVIVLDSRNPGEISKDAVDHYTQIARTLAKLLERV